MNGLQREGDRMPTRSAEPSPGFWSGAPQVDSDQPLKILFLASLGLMPIAAIAGSEAFLHLVPALLFIGAVALVPRV